MKDFNYIDKIIYVKISDMKMPVEKSWGEIQNKLNNTPQTHSTFTKSFWSSVKFKIIGFASVFAVATVSIVSVFNLNNKNTDILIPKESKYNISEIREIFLVENTMLQNSENKLNSNNQNNSNNFLADNNQVTETPKTDSVKVITIIDVNKVVIDTLNQE